VQHRAGQVEQRPQGGGLVQPAGERGGEIAGQRRPGADLAEQGAQRLGDAGAAVRLEERPGGGRAQHGVDGGQAAHQTPTRNGSNPARRHSVSRILASSPSEATSSAIGSSPVSLFW